jgi:hypothetical protein
MPASSQAQGRVVPIVYEYTPPKRNGELLLHAAKTAAETAGAEVLLQASQPLVPRDTDALLESGHVEHDAAGAMVVYDVTSEGGYPYGIKQHEDMNLAHPNGGQAKYLEQPMHTAGAAVLAAMAEVVRART